MVASDTLVGLIGAGVLLVALAGVFVFESRDTSVTKTLALAGHEATPSGSIKITLGTGQQLPPPVGCVPANTCSNGADLDLTLKGLTAVRGDKANYVAMLTGAGKDALVFGPLAASGGDYKASGHKDNVQGYDKLVVSYETDAAPKQPSHLVVYEKPVNTGTAGEQKLDNKFTFSLTGGSGTAKFNDAENGLQVDVTLRGLENHSGYQYRVWVHDEQGGTAGYRFVGNMTLAGQDATLSRGVDGSTAKYEHVFVTLEPAIEPTPTVAGAVGGPIVFVAPVHEAGGGGPGK